MNIESAKELRKQDRAASARRAREINGELLVIRGDKSQSARADKLVDEFISLVDRLTVDET